MEVAVQEASPEITQLQQQLQRRGQQTRAQQFNILMAIPSTAFVSTSWPRP